MKKSKYMAGGGKTKSKYMAGGGKTKSKYMAGGGKTEMYQDYVKRMFGGGVTGTKGAAKGGPGLKKKRQVNVSQYKRFKTKTGRSIWL